MSNESDDVIRRCYEYLEGAQRRTACSAIVHRHIMALLAECSERKCSLEDVQACLESVVWMVLKHKPDEEDVGPAP